MALGLGTMASVASAQALVIDVPTLAPQGAGLKDFSFSSFNFNTYAASPSGSCGDSDFCENIVANLTETYSYLYTPGCSGSGRGGHCGTPPPPYIVTTTTGTPLADTYVTITTPPSALDIRFHFFGTDTAGRPLIFNASDTGSRSATLTNTTTNTVVALGAPLISGDAYTLEYQTTSTAGFSATLTSVPEPGAGMMWLAGISVVVLGGYRRRTAASLLGN